MPRSILGTYERRQPEVRGRIGAEDPRETPRGPHRHRQPDQGREPCPAPAAGNVDLRARQPAAEERTSSWAGRSDDRSIEIDGAGMREKQGRDTVLLTH